MNNIIKNIFIIVGVILISLIFYLAGRYGTTNEKEFTESKEYLLTNIKIPKGSKIISIEDYRLAIKQKKSFIVYHYSDACSDCTKFSNILTEALLKLGYCIDYYDVKMENEDEVEFSKELDIDIIPTIIFYEQGIETSRIEDVV